MKDYPSDLTDKQWKLIAPLIPPPKHGGRPRKTNERLIVDALLYISRTGCQWRYLPEKYPPRSTVYHYFKVWREDSTWDNIVNILREKAREASNRVLLRLLLSLIVKLLKQQDGAKKLVMMVGKK